MGGMPDMGQMRSREMTPEEAQKWADQMMLKLGKSLGVDPEAMENASPEERNRLLQERTAPFQAWIALKGLAPDPNALVIELIHPDTHKVARRFRPVAAGQP